MDRVATTESYCYFCGSKIYNLLRCTWCLHAGCLSCLANDNCVCNKCIEIKQNTQNITVNLRKENLGKDSINCHFCNDEILIPYPLVCKTCKYIGCIKCLNDDCMCNNCVRAVEKFPKSAVCYSCDIYKEVNNEGFCDECIHQTALYHSNESQIKTNYTKSELEFIKNNPSNNSVVNSNHDPVIDSNFMAISPILQRNIRWDKTCDYIRTGNMVKKTRPEFEEKPIDQKRVISTPQIASSPQINVDYLVEKLYPNLGKEGPCKDCGERSTRRVVYQNTVSDPYFLCMSCARCSICGEKNRGRCWIWPADKQLVCGYCVCEIAMEWDNSWNESLDKAVHMSVIIEMYHAKTAKEDYDLICEVRDKLESKDMQLEMVTL